MELATHTQSQLLVGRRGERAATVRPISVRDIEGRQNVAVLIWDLACGELCVRAGVIRSPLDRLRGGFIHYRNVLAAWVKFTS